MHSLSSCIQVLQPSLTAIGGLKQQTRLLRELLLFPMENSEAAEARGMECSVRLPLG